MCKGILLENGIHFILSLVDNLLILLLVEVELKIGPLDLRVDVFLFILQLLGQSIQLGGLLGDGGDFLVDLVTHRHQLVSGLGQVVR